jgi:hypothetical protein
MLHITLPKDGLKNTTWDSRWPTDEGVYWFYGFPWGKKGMDTTDTPDLLCVLVRRIANGFLYVTEGYTIAPEGSQGAVGFWTPVRLPDYPTKANTTDNGKTFRA